MQNVRDPVTRVRLLGLRVPRKGVIHAKLTVVVIVVMVRQDGVDFGRHGKVVNRFTRQGHGGKVLKVSGKVDMRSGCQEAIAWS